MAFVVSQGSIQGLDRVQYLPSYSVQLTHDYTADYAQIWKTQASVRTVVSFLGRNIASLGLHVYRRVSDTDRVRVTDHPLAQLLGKPNGWTTHYRLIDALVQDLAIFDAAYLVKIKDANGVGSLVRIPPQQVEPVGQSWLAPEGFKIRGSRGTVTVPAENMVAFHGYAADGRWGSPPIEALRQVLAEEWEASRMREQTLRNGARVAGYLKRPATASEWSTEARTKFARQWKAQYTGGGPEAGGTPILEEGMEFQPASQTAEQLQYIEARKLTRQEVASVFFIPPPMIGILDQATFSNITEQHKMLYQDTLGPWLRMIEEELSAQLLPDMPDRDGLYVEFNIKEKLRGSFQEEAASMQTAVGGPWMSRNEARARQNLPRIEGGDELIVPLNVLIGGQASPADSGSQNLLSRRAVGSKSAEVVVKARGRQQDAKAAEQVLRRFFKRQRAVVLSALGAKADADWWDSERWDSELSDDLFALAMTVSQGIAADTLDALGFDPDAYDPARTRKFLRAVADSRAGAINSTTRDQIQAALDGDLTDDAEKSTPAGVFDVAEESRSAQAATTLATTLAGFAVTEAIKQTGRPRTTKTWVVTSGNPRPSHAALNGETVPLDDTFSNGAKWPGDAVLDVDEVAGCSCVVDITIP